VPAVCAIDKAALRHRTMRAARERKKEDRLGRRAKKFSFMVTASKNPYGVWPADAIDKRHDGWIGISALEILRPLVHVAPTAVLCQVIKNRQVSVHRLERIRTKSRRRADHLSTECSPEEGNTILYGSFQESFMRFLTVANRPSKTPGSLMPGRPVSIWPAKRRKYSGASTAVTERSYQPEVDASNQ
jgi:hypothetical protein